MLIFKAQIISVEAAADIYITVGVASHNNCPRTQLSVIIAGMLLRTRDTANIMSATAMFLIRMMEMLSSLMALYFIEATRTRQLPGRQVVRINTDHASRR